MPAKKTGPPAAPAMPPPKSSTPPTPVPKPDELGQELSSIYGPTGTKDDMSTLEQARSQTFRKALIGLVVFFGVLSAISWSGFFLFSGARGRFTGDLVELSIEGPAGVTSGRGMDYVVHWKNGERIPLGTASLELRLPEEFSLKGTEPGTEGRVWKIGSVGDGHEGEVRVSGEFVAAAGKELDIQAILTYRPADFNSEFQKVATRTVTVNDSVLAVAAAGPAKALPGDQVTYEFSYENTSTDSAFEGVRIRAAYPAGFVPASSEPAASDDARAEWTIGSLPAGGKGAVKVTGAYASDAKGPQETKIGIGFTGQDETFVLQKEASAATEVLEGDLLTALILNGRAETQGANFGDTLRYALTYKNSGSNVLGDIAVSVVFETLPSPSKMLSWNSLQDNEHGVRDGNTLTWTKKQISGLGKIAPGEEGTIEFELPALSAPLPGITDKDYRIAAHAEAKIGTIDGDAVSRTVVSQAVTAKIQSDASFSAAARYFTDDGVPVGAGPLPPIVGQTTSYRLSWQVKNTFHDLSNLKLSAKLPDDVSWNGKSSVDAGNLAFDAASGKMVWMLNWLPTSIGALNVSFDVSITPTADQEGKLPALEEASIFEATDKLTTIPILLSQPPVTTALENDAAASGKGRVQPAQ